MKRTLKIIGCIFVVLVMLFLLLAGIYHDTTRMVWNNLTQTKNQMSTSTAWEGGRQYRAVPYAEVSAADYVDIYVPENVENPPLLVMVHGGGFVTGDSQSRQSQLVYRYFRDKGYAVASVNYRLAQEAAFPAAVQDVKACVRFLRANADRYGYSANRIAIMGESAGGYLATMAAVTNDEEYNDLPFIGEDQLEEPVSAEVQVLIDYYGCVELGNFEADWAAQNIPNIVIKVANMWATDELLGGFENFESRFVGQNLSELTAEEAERYMPAYYIRKNLTVDSDFHVWIAHGDSDITVPILQSDRLNELLIQTMGENHVKYRVIPKAGHAGEVMFSDEELEQVDNYLQSWLHGYAYLAELLRES